MVVRLGDKQRLTLDVVSAWPEVRLLRVAIRRGRWRWTDYGGDEEHNEVLGLVMLRISRPISSLNRHPLIGRCGRSPETRGGSAPVLFLPSPGLVSYVSLGDGV